MDLKSHTKTLELERGQEKRLPEMEETETELKDSQKVRGFKIF